LLVQHLLEGAASSCPRRTALVAGERRVTYLDLEQEANRVAHTLSEAGVGRGDRVVILLENSVELVASIFGALKLGAVFVVLHASSKRDQLQHVLADAPAPGSMSSPRRPPSAVFSGLAASNRCFLRAPRGSRSSAGRSWTAAPSGRLHAPPSTSTWPR
jgi:acyl-CoA synthetase (AMP-forming)/AMP-acid ligase II